jgi:hypothetical protein
MPPLFSIKNDKLERVKEAPFKSAPGRLRIGTVTLFKSCIILVGNENGE